MDSALTSERPRIGLALSGGIARGPAHLGVLRVLTQAGLPIDCVAGVSAGALVGALYCAGIEIERALRWLRHFGWRAISRPVWPRRGLFSFAKLERWLINLLGDLRFEELRRPLAVVVTDLETWEPVILRSGRLAPAVHASCVPPGFVEPVQIEGRWYADGGASQNLPVAAARELGAQYVIGVDLFQPHLRPKLGALSFGLAALENFIRRSGGGLTGADCLITPELAGVSYFNFRRAASLVEAGASAAEAQLPCLRAALAQRQ